MDGTHRGTDRSPLGDKRRTAERREIPNGDKMRTGFPFARRMAKFITGATSAAKPRGSPRLCYAEAP